MHSQRTIMHIDVNSAFLSWEAAYRLQHGDPVDLREIAAVVGGDPLTRQGIVLAKSIPAKKYQITTGESLFAAKAKCHDLVIVSPNYSLYKQYSSAMAQILSQYSPTLQQFSIDEYFLDYTNLEKLFGTPLEAAHKIKDHIKCELGFTVNVGISSNKLLAKMASDFKKPDQVHRLFPEQIPEKIWPLPIEALFMVGKATARKLRSRGITTIGTLAGFEPEALKSFLKSYGVLLWNYANGIDESPVRTNSLSVKGIGNSTTLPFDAEDRHTAHLVLLSLSETVSARLRQNHYCTRLISVSLCTSEFYTFSHQRKIHNPTDCTNEIWEEACKLFDEVWRGQPLRHLGIRTSDLCHSGFRQLSLFDSPFEKQRQIDRTVDAIRLKYGSKAIIRSAFLNSGLKALTGGIFHEEDCPPVPKNL